MVFMILTTTKLESNTHYNMTILKNYYRQVGVAFRSHAWQFMPTAHIPAGHIPPE